MNNKNWNDKATELQTKISLLKVKSELLKENVIRLEQDIKEIYELINNGEIKWTIKH